MQASVGDRITTIKRPGSHPRTCVVLEVHGPDGAPPYRVRWADTGREVVLIPTEHALVEPMSVGGAS